MRFCGYRRVDGMVHVSLPGTGESILPRCYKVGDFRGLRNQRRQETQRFHGYERLRRIPGKFLKPSSRWETCLCKVVNYALGAFAEIIPGIDGLYHSQISTAIAKAGDVLRWGVVDAKITDLD